MNRFLRPARALLAAGALASGCAVTSPGEELDTVQSSLSVETGLSTLRQRQQNQRDASRALQLVVDGRQQTFYDLGKKKVVRKALEQAKPNSVALQRVKKAIAADEASLAGSKALVEGLVAKHRTALAQLAAELQKQRTLARTEANAVNTTGAFPLHVLVADYTWSLARRIPSLHTEVPVLHGDARCAGDLIIDGTIDRYLRAVLDEKDEEALLAMRDLQTQLNCLSVRQLNLLELALVEQVEGSLSHLLGKDAAPVFRSKARELFAAPILLVADQTRPHTRLKPGLRWLDAHRVDLAKAAGTRGSLLHRAGLYVVDPRRGELVIISSKAWRATAAQPGTTKTALLAARNTKGEWSTNLLPAFLEAFTQPCFAADLVLDGTGVVGETLKCDVGCGAATKDFQRLGVGFGRPVDKSQLAATACLSGGGGGGGGGAGSPGGNTPPGTGGVTVGAGGNRASCVLDAVVGARTDATGKLLGCLAALHPAAGAPGSPSLGVSGGRSCGPNVASGEGEADPSERPWNDDGERTQAVCNDADCTSITFYKIRVEDDGSHTVTDRDTGESYNVAAGEPLPWEAPPTDTDSGAGGTGGGSGTTPPPPPPEPSGGGTGAGPDTGAGGGTGSSDPGDGQCSEWCEGDELDAQGNPHNDNGDEQCGVNPQCRDTAVGVCDPSLQNCSGGCTTNDVGAAFQDCTSTLPERDVSEPSGHVDPGQIYPAPDTTTPSGVGGVLACAAGGQPDVNSCSQQSVALCTQDKPNCACAKAPPISLPNGLQTTMCQQVQCAPAMSSRGESVMAGPSGLDGCGCASVMGQ